MLHTIENDYLKVMVSDHGAELTSVYDKAQDFERIWCADPAVWNRHAPVLFPFVGKVKDGAYRYNGNTYGMVSRAMRNSPALQKPRIRSHTSLCIPMRHWRSIHLNLNC